MCAAAIIVMLAQPIVGPENESITDGHYEKGVARIERMCTHSARKPFSVAVLMVWCSALNIGAMLVCASVVTQAQCLNVHNLIFRRGNGNMDAVARHFSILSFYRSEISNAATEKIIFVFGNFCFSSPSSILLSARCLRLHA